MIRVVETQADRLAFARFGVDCSRYYPNGIPRFLSSELAAFDPATNFFLRIGGFQKAFLLEREGRVVGRIAALIHPEQPSEGLVGWFDCIEDEKIAFSLLDAAALCLADRGCSRLTGPMNGSIYQSYRFMTEGFETETFVGEPRNPSYYPHYFEAYGFRQCHRWLTWELDREGMDRYLARNRPHLEACESLGYRYERLNRRNAGELMRNTYRVLVESYRVFPLYTFLSEADFLQNYDLMPTLTDPDCSRFGHAPDGEFICFTLVIRDLVRALRSMDGRTDLLARLRFLLHSRRKQTANFAHGGTLPRHLRQSMVLAARNGFPGFSLSAATISASLDSVRRKGYRSVLFTLMREEGMVNLQIQAFRRAERVYALYEMSLPTSRP